MVEIASTRGMKKSSAVRRRPGAGAKKLTPIHAEGSDGSGSITKSRKPFSKRDLVESVRKLGPQLRSQSAQSTMSRSSGIKSVADAGSSNQLDIMQAGVNMNARRYNNLKIQADRKASDLKKKIDTLNALKIENDALRVMKNKNTPQSNRIGQLTEELQKATGEIDHKLHYRRQLEHMLRRLKKNQILYNANIDAMDQAACAAEREQQEVEILMRQLEAGKTKATIELHEIQRHIEIERGERKRVLTMRQNEEKQARRMESWRKTQEDIRAELACELRGEMSYEEEQEMLIEIRDAQSLSEKTKKELEEKQQQLHSLEEAFTILRQATGVNSLEEIIDKFTGQENNRRTVNESRMEVEGGLKKAKERKNEAEMQFDKLQGEGIGTTEMNREIADQLNSEIQASRMEVKLTKAGAERLDGIMVAFRQGAMGLFQRLHMFQQQLEVDAIQLCEIERMEPMDCINQSDIILSKMMEMVGVGDASPVRLNQSPGNEEWNGNGSCLDESATWASLGINDLPNPRNNIRIKINEDEQGKPRQRSLDDSDSDSFDDDAVADIVPNRTFIKKSSRQQSEMVRKKEADSRRRKKKQERMNEDDAEKTASGGRDKRKQREAADKLTIRRELVGMPKGITLKDDPITRSTAFLTQMPDLS